MTKVSTFKKFPIEETIQYFMGRGFSKKKATQETWVEYWKSREAQSSVIGGFSYHVSCNTCKEGKEFGAICSVRSFLDRHEGHDTFFRGEKLKWTGKKWGA